TLWRALRGQGLARKAGGDRPGAAAAYREAVEVVEGMRAGIRIEEWKSGFLDDKQDMYEELILLLLDEGRTREAFLYAERARARGFVDLLGAARLDLGDKLAQGAYERILELSRRVEERAAEERGAPEKDRQKSSRAVVAARRALAEAVERARLDAPGALPFVTVEPVDLDKLFALLGERVALLEYVVARGETVIFTVFNGEVSARRVKVERAALERMLGEYRALIQEGAPARERARELYRSLVEPAADIVARAEVVGIAPHRALHYLSFASLHDGEAYLIDRAPLFYLPAASVFGYAAARRGTAPREEMRVLAVGNPDLGELNYDLPLAELEAKSIRWAIPSVDTLIGREATKRAATENIGRYQVVHIASHGEFDPVNPLMSALRLAPEPGETGALTAREVFGLRLAADLVIMSACQTGLGKVSAGDEVAGLNRAFLASGAHAVISTLWRVDDLASASLVKHFYRGYVDMDAAKALRAAQLTVKARQPHPRYWAGFILAGDYQ
ncbi:MAG: CHAT domain-containing protein, partial [Nitrospinae bacterium]|nr:CHAT domain-containing protein [Nitrospinota bacterium]